VYGVRVERVDRRDDAFNREDLIEEYCYSPFQNKNSAVCTRQHTSRSNGQHSFYMFRSACVQLSVQRHAILAKFHAFFRPEKNVIKMSLGHEK
jgi:hypothetical protein